MKYRKKPVDVDAFCFGIDNMPDWFMDRVTKDDIILQPGSNYDIKSLVAHINTLEGVMTAHYGDFIIKGVAGEVYSCKPDIFEATYDRVDELNDIPTTF